MSISPRGSVLAALRRLAPPTAGPDASDAELLRKYVAGRDEGAFAELVRRHGPMVLGVCRRRLGRSADADDAFQVVFMVLARDAAKIENRESPAGWLYRVAYLVALKWAGKAHRCTPGELLVDAVFDPRPGPEADASGGELQAVVGEELNALPDKLRAVVVLCGLEERTNAEAAQVLGCPVGTVDSRLSAARAKLRDRLTRRGVAVPAVALGGLVEPLASANAVSESLVNQTLRAAAAYAAGGAGVDPLSSFADGVSSTMSTLRVKLFLAAGMSAAVLGSAGFGLFTANADTPAKEKVAAAAPAAEVAAAPAGKDAPPKKPGKPAALPVTETAVRDTLNQPLADLDLNAITFRDLLELLHEKHGLVARIDTPSFKRLSNQQEAAADANAYYDQQIKIPVSRGMTVADLLNEAIAQLPGKATYRIRGGQVVVVPAYIPPVVPGSGFDASGNVTTQLISSEHLSEQLHGDPVSFVADGKTLTEAVKELRKLTGANIVIDARFRDKAKEEVDGSFNDTRLLTVLQVLGDMADLKPVTLNNVFYLTDAKNAEKLQKQVNRELFGDSAACGQPAAPQNPEAQKALHFVEVVKGLLHPAPPAAPEPAPAPSPEALKEMVKDALKELLAKPAAP
jgi:RNA polymerase sigma factor (sigma-70 family)